MAATLKSEPVPLRVDEYGAIRVGNTNVIFDLVVHAFMNGASAEAIAESWDTLDLGDVYLALGYYLHHKSEIDAYLEDRVHEAAEIRAKIEATQNHNGLRERLLARLENTQC